MANILAVDDNIELCKLIRTALERDGHRVETRLSGAELTEQLCHWADCILLDVMMPGEDGFAVCRRIRGLTDAPILFLTARTDEASVLEGRPRGAKMEGETVIAGVDTHKDVHVLCLLDGLGRKIWSGSFGADPEGYDRLAEAIGDPGSCMVVGVEGTASYGAGLTRRLVELGYNVVEVFRPKRDKVRPGEGKSDPLDAERAARKAASGRGCSVPKSQDGWVEAVRQLYVARRLAVATSTSCVALLALL